MSLKQLLKILTERSLRLCCAKAQPSKAISWFFALSETDKLALASVHHYLEAAKPNDDLASKQTINHPRHRFVIVQSLLVLSLIFPWRTKTFLTANISMVLPCGHEFLSDVCCTISTTSTIQYFLVWTIADFLGAVWGILCTSVSRKHQQVIGLVTIFFKFTGHPCWILLVVTQAWPWVRTGVSVLRHLIHWGLQMPLWWACFSLTQQGIDTVFIRKLLFYFWYSELFSSSESAAPSLLHVKNPLLEKGAIEDLSIQRLLWSCWCSFFDGILPLTVSRLEVGGVHLLDLSSSAEKPSDCNEACISIKRRCSF